MTKLYASKYMTNAEFGFRSSLLKRPGMLGKASRYGFKKLGQGKRFTKRIGRAGISRVKNSSFLRKRFKNIGRKWG